MYSRQKPNKILVQKMVFKLRFLKLICSLSLLLFIAACSSTGGQSKQESNADIYSALTDDEVQYRDDEQRPASDLDQELVNEHLTKIRNLYFRKNYKEAQELAERLLRLDANLPEAYYWLARVYMGQTDYQGAYDMASKGLSVADNASLKGELERIQRQAQMGNY